MLPGKFGSDSAVTARVLSIIHPVALSPVLVNHKSYEEIMDSLGLAV